MSTNCSVIVSSENKQALLDLLTVEGVAPDLFSAGLSETGLDPATHYISSGYFLNSELNIIVDSGLADKIHFVDPDVAVEALGLQFIDAGEA